MKFYIFVRNDGEDLVFVCVFVGFSNISKIVLIDGIEWNYCINYFNDKDFEVIVCIEEICE